MTPRSATRWVTGGLLAMLNVGVLRAQTLPQTAPTTSSQADVAEPVIPIPPAQPPKVTCNHGLLTISATNSTFSSVVSAVEACLGFQIKVPGGAGGERVFVELGPGPAGRVLDDLLSSSDFNYAIVLSETPERKVTGVVLTSRAEDQADAKTEHALQAPAGLVMTPARRIWLASQGSSGRPMTTTQDASLGAPDTSSASASDPAESTSAEQASQPPTDAAGGSAAPQGGPANTVPLVADPRSTGIAASVDGSGIGSNTLPTDQGVTAAPAAASSGEPAAPPATVSAPASPQAAPAEKAPDNGLGQQINQMQQMFEQRKKLSANPAPPQDPQ